LTHPPQQVDESYLAAELAGLEIETVVTKEVGKEVVAMVVEAVEAVDVFPAPGGLGAGRTAAIRAEL
jgi:hypothetical protein